MNHDHDETPSILASRKSLCLLGAALAFMLFVLTAFANVQPSDRSYAVVQLSTRVESAMNALNDLGKKGYSLVTVIRSPHDENWAFLMK
jgi:exosortase/archaeosortase